MKRFPYLALFCCACLLIQHTRAATSEKLNALSDVQASVAKMPFYKDKRLEFFLTSSKVNMQGTLLTAQWPIIDIIRAGVNVESIGQTPVVKGIDVIYRLHTDVDEVVKFWEARPYSEGIITSENADVDQVRKLATGKQKVYFRSPSLDLNGVGFTADFVNRTVTVHSEVEIDLRNAGSSALGSSLIDTSEKKPQESGKEVINVTRAFCDELTIDINRNTVILTGNVRVFDDAGSITSEALEIELGKDDEQDNGNALDDSNRAVGNIKEVRFIGSVHAVRTLTEEEKTAGEQEAHAHYAAYQVQDDLLTLTGLEETQPILSRGDEFARANRIELHPKKRMIEFFEKCRFEFLQEEDGQKSAEPTVITTRHAVYDDANKKINLQGDIRLVDRQQNADLSADKVDLELSKTGASRPEHIVAQGNVSLARENEGVQEKATAGRMTYMDKGQTVLMEDSPQLFRGKDTISGKSMLYYMETQRLKVTGNSHIFIADSGEAASGTGIGKSDASQSIDVYSDDADLNYGGNQLLFIKNVKIDGRGAKLRAQQLDITLKEEPGNSNKVPTRAVATQKVHVEDQSGMLDTEMLDIRFITTAAQKTDVSHIYADNGVKIQSFPDRDTANNSTLLGKSGTGTTSLTARRGDIDLLKNVADFYEKVKVFDDQATLDCEHLHIVAKPLQGAIPPSDSSSEDEFPSRLAIGSDRELESITALENVVATRTENGVKQYAKGDRAYYLTSKREVELTAVPPKKPLAVTKDGGMIGDKVIIDLDTHDIFVDNGDALTKYPD